MKERLRGSSAHAQKRERDIDEALRVLKSGLREMGAMIFVISLLGGVSAVMFLRVGQFIVDRIMGALSRWWAG